MELDAGAVPTPPGEVETRGTAAGHTEPVAGGTATMPTIMEVYLGAQSSSAAAATPMDEDMTEQTPATSASG
eukprot:10748845-Prorocentrum_lima.AAC.1